jgi:hypothetical protein
MVTSTDRRQRPATTSDHRVSTEAPTYGRRLSRDMRRRRATKMESNRYSVVIEAPNGTVTTLMEGLQVEQAGEIANACIAAIEAPADSTIKLIDDGHVTDIPQPRPRPKQAPPRWTPDRISSTPWAKRFLAWAAVIEYNDVNPHFHPEDDFGDVMIYVDGDYKSPVKVWDDESATRLNACMTATFDILGYEGVFEALHEIYKVCGYEDADGEPTA